jgi:hypothetical protein
MPALVLAWSFDYEIFSDPGGILGNSPVVYDGVLLSGGDGTVSITLDDTGWPGPGDPDTRFNYIWANYFAANYDTSGGTARWIGEMGGRFSITSMNAPGDYNGTCEGSVVARITVRDFNEDGVLNDGELYDRQHLFDGLLSKLCDDFSSGQMACSRGFGSINSNFFSFYPSLYPPSEPPDPLRVDTLYNGAQLTLYWVCASPAETPSWGAIKALYK